LTGNLTGRALPHRFRRVEQKTARSRQSLYNFVMRAHVYVTLKTTVLDAQGQTIANALRRLHHPQVESVRQGKYFVLTLSEGLTSEAAEAEVKRIASEVLTNPVIEEFTYKIDA
jgi:phosphoribosylformylglycinamidine synthase PurS subunit